MTITVAMALSGLEPDQWNDGLKDIYMQGAILFPKSPSTLSLASSGASSYYSLESGISSMSPDCASYNQFLLNDLDGLGLDGMVQIQEQIQDFEEAKPKNNDCIIQNTSLATSISKEESFKYNGLGTAMLKPEVNEQTIISTLLSKFVVDDSHEKENGITDEVVTEPKMQPCKIFTQVMYKNRNLLNLFDNIKYDGWKYQATILPENINSFYFENRSQYSRLQDAYPPKHAKATCRDKDCAFVETKYF